MEKSTSFIVYYDYDEIENDGKGNIDNENVLYIAEYDEDGNFIRRVDRNGNEIEMDIPVDEMEKMDFIGDGEETPQKSFDCLMRYLEYIWEVEGYEPSCTMVPYGDTWVEYWC